MNNIAESNRVIKRDRYLNKIISYMWDGQIKVITGIRRCGKSYLLDKLFRQYSMGNGKNCTLFYKEMEREIHIFLFLEERENRNDEDIEALFFN